MKAAVVYDSKYGNTERLARTIAEKLGTGEPPVIVAATDAGDRELVGIGLLVVGGPTQGHGVSAPLRAFLTRISQSSVQDVSTATFDTRLPWPRVLSGSAATGVAKRLTKKGARLIVPPESFLVAASEGPLAEGEEARAQTWAASVGAAAHSSVAVH